MQIVHLYKSLIDMIVAWGGSAALLHVHVGMTIYLAVLLLVRQRRANLLALQIVLAAELGNEVMDWLNASPDWTWSDTAADFALTLLWPVAITAVLAWRRRRWQDRSKPCRDVARFHFLQRDMSRLQSPESLPDGRFSR